MANHSAVSHGASFDPDIERLRQIDEDLHNIPASSFWDQLRHVNSYSLPTESSNIDIDAKMKRGRDLGLQCESVCVDHSGYLAVHLNGSAMIIEDDEAKQVTHRMLAAGVPIAETYVD